MLFFRSWLEIGEKGRDGRYKTRDEEADKEAT